ncbi:MAG: hypothetical protein WCJ02_00945 [bacterium]
MSKIKARMGIVVLLLFIGTGCVNYVETNNVALKGLEVVGTPGVTEECVTVSNYGYYLFNMIPVFCGNTVDGHIGNTVWFQNHVTLERTQSVMMREINPMRPLVTNIQPHSFETCFFSVIPYIGNSLGIVWYKQIDLSAVLVKPKTKGKTP